MADAQTLFVDSVKDAALGLVDDETGAGWNRARQTALVEGVELVELHHLVKRGPNGAAPRTLADVYGSTWLTAGCGSVVMLWGEAGDPLVQWHHIKQPGDEVGPFTVAHAHRAGTSTIWEQVDLVALAVTVCAAGADGLAARDAARAIKGGTNPSDAETQKARRRLSDLEAEGALVRHPGGGTASRPDVWRPR